MSRPSTSVPRFWFRRSHRRGITRRSLSPYGCHQWDICFMTASPREELAPENDFLWTPGGPPNLRRSVGGRSRERGRKALKGSSSEISGRPHCLRRCFVSSRVVKQSTRPSCMALRPSSVPRMYMISSGSGGATLSSSKSLVISSIDLSRSLNHSSESGSIFRSDDSGTFAIVASL